MAPKWNLLPLGLPRACATDECERPAVYELEAGGVASNYCMRCRDIIDAQREISACFDRALRESVTLVHKAKR